METLKSDNYKPNNQCAATDYAKLKASKPATMTRMVKIRIGYDSKEEEVHDV